MKSSISHFAAKTVFALSLLFGAFAGQGCLNTVPTATPAVPLDPVVGHWNRDTDVAGAGAGIVFAKEHYALTVGGKVVRWNIESPNFYKVNHTDSPVELYYLANPKTLYLLGYGSNSQELRDIVTQGFDLDDLHERGLLPLLVKYKLVSKPTKEK